MPQGPFRTAAVHTFLSLDHCTNLGAESVERERFRQHVHAGVQKVASDRSVLRIAGQKENFQIRPEVECAQVDRIRVVVLIRPPVVSILNCARAEIAEQPVECSRLISYTSSMKRGRSAVTSSNDL